MVLHPWYSSCAELPGPIYSVDPCVYIFSCFLYLNQRRIVRLFLKHSGSPSGLPAIAIPVRHCHQYAFETAGLPRQDWENRISSSLQSPGTHKSLFCWWSTHFQQRQHLLSQWDFQCIRHLRKGFRFIHQQFQVLGFLSRMWWSFVCLYSWHSGGGHWFLTDPLLRSPSLF